MDFLTIFLGFTLGAIVGSFLNVLILRYNTGRSLGGRSACLSCGCELSWRELVPIFSFLWARGRCKHCGSSISLQYPLVEITTGVIFAAVIYKEFLTYNLQPTTYNLYVICYLLFVWSLLISVAVYDLRHKIIPNGFVWTFVAVSFANLLAMNDFSPPFWSFWAGPVLALPFALIWFLSGGRAMGLGDAKLALGLGWMLGLANGLTAALLSFWIGGLAGIFLLLKKGGRFTMKSEIPFAPFLVLAAFLSDFFNLDFLGLARLL